MKQNIQFPEKVVKQNFTVICMEYQVNDGKNPRKSLGSAGSNLTYLPHGTKSKITTRWRHQTVIKE